MLSEAEFQRTNIEQPKNSPRSALWLRLRLSLATHDCDAGIAILIRGRSLRTRLPSNGAGVRMLQRMMFGGLAVDHLDELPEGERQNLNRLVLELLSVGALCFDFLDSEGGPLATLIPESPSWRPPESPSPCAADSLIRSPLLMLTASAQGELVVTSPVGGVSLQVNSRSLAAALLPGRQPAEALAAAGPLLFSWLAASAFFVDAADQLSAMWSAHDMHFHVTSREGRFGMPRGTRPERLAAMEAGPANRPQWPGPRIGLPRPARTRIDLDTVLECRRSGDVRHAYLPLSREQLGQVLWMSSRAYGFGTGEFGMQLSQRPYASAGSCHPLEIYVAVNNCTGLTQGLWHYENSRHTLARVCMATSATEAILKKASGSIGLTGLPDVLLVVAARFSRSFFKYEGVAYANILRELGGLTQTVQLASVASGCTSCPVGAGNIEFFAAATGLSPFEEGAVGEICLMGGLRR